MKFLIFLIFDASLRNGILGPGFPAGPKRSLAVRPDWKAWPPRFVAKPLGTHGRRGELRAKLKRARRRRMILPRPPWPIKQNTRFLA